MKSLRNSYPGLMNVKNSLPFLVVLLLLSTLSLAEKADRDKPIEIESDTMTMDDTKNVSIYTGDVILTQGTLIIKADELIVREDNQGFQHSTSTGNPTSFKQKREGVEEYIEGIGQRIEYDGHMDKVHIYRNAIVKREMTPLWAIILFMMLMQKLLKQCPANQTMVRQTIPQRKKFEQKQ